ncbi:MAG: Wzz/FepE/Etk N-terminal domain-containing protein [Desulfobulbaceae bacterium]|nr:Wzz/FepE/Etk N-terminal domain-containing protein [Desulfobulbaceae bacterium]
MDIQQRRIIKKYLDILLRRKKLIIFFLLLGTALGLGFYVNTSKVYTSSALLKYQRQQINPTRMSPDDLRTATREIVDTVGQQILTRSSLESIIKEFDLYSGMRETMSMEDIVNVMRTDHIHTQFLQTGGDIFQVSFQGNDQNKVMRVTNELAAKFIEENLRYRQERASLTSTYVKDELKMAKEALDEKELLMRDYKLQYYNEMPEQLMNNMNRLSSLQIQYQNNQTSNHELERTRLLVQEQMASRRDLLAQAETAQDLGNASSGGGPGDIYQVRMKLQSLENRYTEKHPEIRRLKKIIHDYESQDNSGSRNANYKFDQQLQELGQQLKDLEMNISRLQEERENLAEQIQKYEKWIAATPVREAEWSGLTRDYQQLHERYQQLVTKSLEAESARSLENQLEGSQFKIIESAHFPEKPTFPDFKIIMLAALGLGLGTGAILAIGIDFLGTSFKDPVELEDFLEVPVVCAVPAIYTKNEVVRKKAKNIALNLFLLFAAAVLISVAIYLWKQGIIII